MRLPTRAKAGRRTAEAHPPALVREARRLLLATGDSKRVAAALGIHRSTVLTWNRRYGWVRLVRGPKGGPNVTHPASSPRQWRCDCGRLNTETPCAGCGYQPGWAA